MDEEASTQSDYDLAVQIACGDEDALRALIGAHGPRVRSYLKKRFPVIWEDAWQRSLIRVTDKIGMYDPAKGGLGPWFLKLAHNCALSVLRAEKKHKGVPVLGDISRDERRPPKAEQTRKQREHTERRAQQIREVVAALPPKERRVIEADLAFWQGDTSPDETASAVELAEAWGDTNANAVHQARSRALKKLREELVRRGIYSEESGP